MGGVRSTILTLVVTVMCTLRSAAPAQSQEAFIVWVASYRSIEDARTGHKALAAMDFALFSSLTAYIQQLDLGDKGTWYRLQLGPPRSRDAMERLCGQILALGHAHCKIVSPYPLAATSKAFSG